MSCSTCGKVKNIVKGFGHVLTGRNKELEKMISVIYPLGKGSRHQNIEIRYSLRSVQKHLKGLGSIWIVGEKPDFLKDVNHIPLKDTQPISDSNIFLKIKAACEHPEISDTFLFFNDDHYLLQDFEADKFPYYYCSTISEYLKRRSVDSYAKRVRNTQKSLKERNLPDKHFDIHYPILYNKKAFLEHVVPYFDLKDKTGFVIKSMYANALKIEGEETRDYKLQSPPPEKKCKVFSTYPKISGAIYRFLEYKFPNKSIYEK